MTRATRLAVYTAVVVVSVAAIAAVVHLGTRWYPTGVPGLTAAPTPPPAAPTAPPGSEAPLPRLLAQLLVIVAATQVGGRVARRLGQPGVIGEIAAGVLLGPSLVGALFPGPMGALFPAASFTTLYLLSQVGVILFMFGVGLDVDTRELRRRASTAVAVSHFSIAVPFLLGTAAALTLYPRYAPAGVPFVAFALFMGIALSITAFPVLARILEERRLTDTPLGATALACAAVDDLTAWTLLALVVTLVTSGGVGATLAVMATALAAFLAAAFGVVRPVLAHLADRYGVTATTALTPAVIVLLAGALATEAIGIHALFGAFVAGLIMPRDPVLRRGLRDRLHPVVAVVLLPAFFAVTGLRTDIGRLGAEHWLVAAAVIGLATAGKLGGSVVAARATGESWRDALALGALMNTRGLMELVALNVGYDLGILSPPMFTMLVVMALVTTAMTSPCLDRALAAPLPAGVTQN